MKQSAILGVLMTLLTFIASTLGIDTSSADASEAAAASPSSIVEEFQQQAETSPQPSPSPSPTPASASVSYVDRSLSYDEYTTVEVLSGEDVVSMTLKDFLVRVVAAEMPSSFEPEALKAQAIAARTNVVRKLTAGSKHDNADICTDSACCMACAEPNEAAQEAVVSTDGLVVTYNGEPIDAVFFSTSWGATEDAIAVWGSEVPYLVSVESVGDELSPRYEDSVEISLTDFCLKVSEAAPDAIFSGVWIGEPVYTEAGGVETIALGGVEFTGREVRTLFGLRSTNFTVEVTATCVRFSTTGFGHNVGMSQYGANAMALGGSDYEEILTWYYTGTKVDSLSVDFI